MTPEDSARIVRLIEPKLGAVPIYPCFTSAMSALDVAHSYGFQGRRLDIALHGYLVGAGQWEGRGLAHVVNDVVILADCRAAADGDEVMAIDLAEQRILSVTVHEIAHALQVPLDLSELPAEQADKIYSQHSKALVAWCSDERVLNNVPFADHDARFIRVLCHAVHRFEQRDERRLLHWAMFNSEQYGLSGLCYYQNALGDEPARYSGLLCDLPQITPPKAFVKLWNDDLRGYVESLKADTQVMLDLIDAAQLFPISQQGEFR